MLSILVGYVLQMAWDAFRRPVVLTVLIVGFVGGGIAALIASVSVHGWWGDFLLNVGVNMIFVGGVDVLILGMLSQLIEGTAHQAPPEPSLELQDLAAAVARIEQALSAEA